MANNRDGPDWKKIKAEYLKGVPPRKIAEKYGVNPKTLTSRCYREGWTNDRKEVAEKTQKKYIEKIAEKEADRTARTAEMIDEVGFELMRYLVGTMKKFPDGAGTKIVRKAVKVQIVDGQKMPTETTITTDIKDIAAAMGGVAKTLGLDTASKLAVQKQHIENGTDETAEDDGFLDAIAQGCAEAWTLADEPANIHDSDDETGV